nr:response regulator [Anaerolineae bacterium]
MITTILAVDDEVRALTLISLMLERGGYQVIKALNGYEALELLDQSTPDLIILDVMMPGLDGITLCRLIRERPATADVPIVILSALGDPASIEEGYQAGASDYLHKPIKHLDLLTKISTLAKNRSA